MVESQTGFQLLSNIDGNSNTYKCENMADPSANQDYVTKKYLTDNYTTSANNALTYLKLDCSNDPLTQNLDMNTKKIVGLGDPADAQDAVTKNYLTSNYTTSANLFRVYNRNAAGTTITNTNAETSWYSFTVTGGVMSTDKGFRIRLVGYIFNNSGGAKTFVIKIKYDDTVMFEETSASISTSATLWHCIDVDLIFANQNNASVQVLGGKFYINNSDAATTGHGDFAAASTQYCNTAIYGTAAEDSSTDKTFAITITPSAAHASYNFYSVYAFAEILL